MLLYEWVQAENAQFLRNRERLRVITLRRFCRFKPTGKSR